MTASIADIPKKRGRKPSGGRKDAILVRMPPEQLEAVEAWAGNQPDAPSRPEAIRRLVEKGLVG
jgi:hypothetical protein